MGDDRKCLRSSAMTSRERHVRERESRFRNWGSKLPDMEKRKTEEKEGSRSERKVRGKIVRS